MTWTTIATILYDGTYGLIGIAILILIWLALYIRRRHVTPTREAMVGASWGAMIVAILLRFLKLLNDWHLGITILILIITIVFIINRD